MRKRLTSVVAAAACAAAVAACGGDDAQTTPADTAPSTTGASGSETAPATGALDKKEYLQQADEICARTNEELSDVQDFQAEGPPIIEGALGELRALPAPEGDEEQLNEVYTEGEEALGTIQGATEPPQGDPFKSFTKAAEDYGFEGGCTGNEG